MIYFITQQNHKFVKIGYTRDIDTRLSSLQVGNPYKLDVYAVIKGDSFQEWWFQKKFQAHRIRGEWFIFHDDIRKAVDTIVKDTAARVDAYNDLPQPETLDNGRMTYHQVSDYIKENSLWDD